MKFQITEVPFASAQRPDAVAKVARESEAIRDVTWIKIEQVTGRNWALGGQPVHALAIRRRPKPNVMP